MKIEQLKRIFDFLEEKEGKKHKKEGTFEWKLIFSKPFTEEELNVKGDLNYVRSKITSLPKGLKVEGNLNLRASDVSKLPERLKVGGSLYLSNTKITSLPEGLEVGGDLYLRYTSITLLPKGLKVEGDLFTRGTELEKLSDDELREMIKPGFIKRWIVR